VFANPNIGSILKKESVEAEISQLSIDWTVGQVRVIQGEGEAIKIIQSGSSRIPERKLFRHRVDAGELSIIDGRKRRPFIGLNLHQTSILVSLPRKKLNELVVICTGGHLIIECMDAGQARCTMTSGRADLSGTYQNLNLRAVGAHIAGKQLTVNRLELESSSSKVSLEGAFCKEIRSRTTGRRVSIQSALAPSRIHSISTGAKVELSIPENTGFTLTSKKISGDIQTRFLLNNQTEHSYKDGRNGYFAEVRGGSFVLQKNAADQASARLEQ